MIIFFLKLITIFTLIGVSGFQVVLIINYYQNPNKVIETKEIVFDRYQSEMPDDVLEALKLSKINKNPRSEGSLKVIGWIADWGIRTGLEDLRKRAKSITSVSPFLFVPNNDGSLKDLTNAATEELKNYSRNSKIEYIGTIPLFDENILRNILTSQENMNRHINQIIDRITRYNLDGIDLDYESTYLADKRLFFDFLSKLSSETKRINKKLVFTVMPKWGNYIQYPSLAQTRRVQDYKRIAELVDEFRIMSYDFTRRSSETAGPLAPLPWMEQIIQYAINEGVPREKLVLGIHNYSYVWKSRPILEKLDLIYWFGHFGSARLESALAYNYEDVEATLKAYSVNKTYNPEWGEVVAKFNLRGEERIMIYLDDIGIQARKNLALEYGLAGVAYWRLGNNGNLKL